MIDAKHTPGPWILEKGSEILAKTKSTVTRICVMPHYGNGKSSTGEANAHLIAAAPELLEALEEVRRHVVENLTKMYGHSEFGEIRRIDAAIAKAKGGAP
jgi:hypothetical protein